LLQGETIDELERPSHDAVSLGIVFSGRSALCNT
jgi:hypothetical protein